MIRTTPYPFEVQGAARQLGANIGQARKRRRMTQDELAIACGTTRKTVATLERGSPGTTIGTVFSILWKLGLLAGAAALADPDADEHGKILEAARQPQRIRPSIDLDNDF